MFNELNNNNSNLKHINYLQYKNYFNQHPLTQTIVEDQSYHVSSQYDRLSQLIQKSYQQLQQGNQINMQKGNDNNNFISYSPSYLNLNQHQQQFVTTKRQQNHHDRQLILQGLLKNWQYRHHQNQQQQYQTPIYQSTIVNQSATVSSQNHNNNNNNHKKYQSHADYYNSLSQNSNKTPNNQSPTNNYYYQQQQNSQYYNFVPKHSTIPIMYSNNSSWMIENEINKHVNNSNNFHIRQQEQVKQQSFSKSTTIQRPGFIKQQRRLNHGSISSLQSYKPQHLQQQQQQQKYNQFTNNQISVNNRDNLVRECKQYCIGRQQQQNNFYQCNGQKNNNNLATTLSSTITNNLPTSNLSSTYSKNHPFLTTTRPDSSIPQDNFEDSLQLQHNNPNNNLRRQYEQDLFEFIKQQLIRVTIQNRQLLLLEGNQLNQNNSQQKAFNKQKHLNRQLYNLYRQTKQSFYRIKHQEQLEVQSITKQIKILTQQLVFYKQQQQKISTSISVKLQKQQQLYFKNKVNLQNVLIKNNQMLSQLNSQLQQRSNKGQQNQNLVFNDLVQQNNRLKQQLLKQQQLCNNQFNKLINTSSAINQLQLKKQQHLNQLFKQLQYAKQLANYRLDKKNNNK